MRIVAQLSCDYCGETLIGLCETAALSEARRDGWVLDRDLDHMCPDCAVRADLGPQARRRGRAVVGTNLVKPSADAMAAAMVAADWDGACWPDDFTLPDQSSYLRRAHATLELWPGHTTAAVQATALREAVGRWCHANEDHQLHLQRCVLLLEEADRLETADQGGRRS